MLKRNVISKIISTFAFGIIIVVTIKNAHLTFANLYSFFSKTDAIAKVNFGVSDNSGHLWTK